eukprot:365680-Chlamydomonas_euryale.AAC.6
MVPPQPARRAFRNSEAPRHAVLSTCLFGGMPLMWHAYAEAWLSGGPTQVRARSPAHRRPCRLGCNGAYRRPCERRSCQ